MRSFQPAAQIIAVRIGQVNIDQREIGGSDADLIDRLSSRGGFYDLQPRTAQDARPNETCRLEVLDVKNEPSRCHRNAFLLHGFQNTARYYYPNVFAESRRQVHPCRGTDWC